MPKTEDDGETPHFTLVPGTQITYTFDREERIGQIQSVDGEYIQLSAGISIHTSDVRGVVVHPHEAEFTVEDKDGETAVIGDHRTEDSQ